MAKTVVVPVADWEVLKRYFPPPTPTGEPDEEAQDLVLISPDMAVEFEKKMGVPAPAGATFDYDFGGLPDYNVDVPAALTDHAMQAILDVLGLEPPEGEGDA